MSKIDDLIKQYCPNGVEYKELGSICIIEKGQQLNKDSLLDKGLYPVMNGGIAPSGYWDEYNTEKNTTIISQGGASAGYTQFMYTPFWAGAHCYTVTIRDNNKYLNRFIFHFLKNNQEQLMNNQYGAGIPALSKKSVEILQIPVPPLPVQEEIVRILDSFAELEQELEKELEARKKQYEHYRNQLLSFDKNTTGGGIKWKALGEIANIQRGKRLTKSQLLAEGDFPVFQNSLTPLGFFPQYNCQQDTTFLIVAGAAGDIGYSKSPFWAADDCFYFQTTNAIINKYIFYSLEKNKMLLKSKVRRAGVPRLSRQDIEKIIIPIPSLEEQERIVAILDKFDSLVNSISEGLPAEIDARKKQYEYYRNKLLTFDEAA